MNVTTPSEMVAADQLFKSVLQQSNTAICDKETEINNVFCPEGYSVNSNIDCNICNKKDICVSKERIETLKSELQSIMEERVEIMNKYSELQDSIKNYILS